MVWLWSVCSWCRTLWFTGEWSPLYLNWKKKAEILWLTETAKFYTIYRNKHEMVCFPSNETEIAACWLPYKILLKYFYSWKQIFVIQKHFIGLWVTINSWFHTDHLPHFYIWQQTSTRCNVNYTKLHLVKRKMPEMTLCTDRHSARLTTLDLVYRQTSLWQYITKNLFWGYNWSLYIHCQRLRLKSYWNSIRFHNKLSFSCNFS